MRNTLNHFARGVAIAMAAASVGLSAGPSWAAPAVRSSRLSTAESTSTTGQIVQSGTLNWGVRDSFLRALQGPMHGSWTTAEGASWNTATRQFTFKVDEATNKQYVDVARGTANVKYAGVVHFKGVGGILDLKMTDPELEVGEGTDHLKMTVTSNDMRGVPRDFGRINLVDLQASITGSTGNHAQITGTQVKLSSQAVGVFGAFYRAGAHMDDLDSLLKLAPSTGPHIDPSTPTVTPTPSSDSQDRNDADGPKDDSRSHDKHKPTVKPTPRTEVRSTSHRTATKYAAGQVSFPQASRTTMSHTIEQVSAPKARKTITKRVCTTVNDDSASASVTMSNGRLSWGVNKRFLRALQGPMHGSWKTTGGASSSGLSITFPFKSGNYDPTTKSGTVNFGGSVHFSGVGGLLDLTLAQPTVSVQNGKGVFTLTMNAGGRAPFHGRVPFANVTIQSSGSGFSATSVKLTKEAVPVWNGFYTQGQEMDHFTVTLGGSGASAVTPKAPKKKEICHDVVVDAETGEVISKGAPGLPAAGV